MSQPTVSADDRLIPMVSLKQLADRTGSRRDILQTIARQVGIKPLPLGSGKRPHPHYRLEDAERIEAEFREKHLPDLLARTRTTPAARPGGPAAR